MRVWVVCSMLALVVASGCAETPEDEAVDDVGASDGGNETIGGAALAGRFLPTIDAKNITAGVPFNVTVDYVGDNGTDASLLDWDVSFYAEQGSDDGAGNATAGNATAGNGTTAGGNATDDAGEALASFNGTGLPATLVVNLTQGGNITLAGTVTDGQRTAALEQAVLTVLDDVVGDPGDPCAGVPVQDPITISDIFVAVAVDGTGLYQGHGFDLAPCQTLVFAEITSGEAYLDPMLRLKDHTGAEVDAEDNEFLYHDTLTYEPGGYLEPGTWQIDARGYIGAPGTYEIVLSFEMPE